MNVYFFFFVVDYFMPFTFKTWTKFENWLRARVAKKIPWTHAYVITIRSGTSGARDSHRYCGDFWFDPIHHRTIHVSRDGKLLFAYNFSSGRLN